MSDKTIGHLKNQWPCAPTVPSFESMVSLSRLVLRFGQVHRVTTDAEGRPESDTTHSLMLALLAGSLASDPDSGLDTHAVVMLSLVHDIAEAYAQDTNTIGGLGPEARAEKDRREAEALIQVRKDLVDFPWILSWIDRYEAQACPESQFVKVVDKGLPKLSHADNDFIVPRTAGMSKKDLVERHAKQGQELRAKYLEQELAHIVFATACSGSEAAWKEGS